MMKPRTEPLSLPLGFVHNKPHAEERMRLCDTVDDDWIVTVHRGVAVATGALDICRQVIPILDSNAPSNSSAMKIFLATVKDVKAKNFLVYVDNREDEQFKPNFISRHTSYREKYMLPYGETSYKRIVRHVLADDDVVIVDNRNGSDFPQGYNWVPEESFLDHFGVKRTEIEKLHSGRKHLFCRWGMPVKVLEVNSRHGHDLFEWTISGKNILNDDDKVVEDYAKGCRVYTTVATSTLYAVQDIVNNSDESSQILCLRDGDVVRRIAMPEGVVHKKHDRMKKIRDFFQKYREETTVTVTEVRGLQVEGVTKVNTAKYLIQQELLDRCIGDYVLDVATIRAEYKADQERKRKANEASLPRAPRHFPNTPGGQPPVHMQQARANIPVGICSAVGWNMLAAQINVNSQPLSEYELQQAGLPLTTISYPGPADRQHQFTNFPPVYSTATYAVAPLSVQTSMNPVYQSYQLGMPVMQSTGYVQVQPSAQIPRRMPEMSWTQGMPVAQADSIYQQESLVSPYTVPFDQNYHLGSNYTHLYQQESIQAGVNDLEQGVPNDQFQMAANGFGMLEGQAADFSLSLEDFPLELDPQDDTLEQSDMFVGISPSATISGDVSDDTVGGNFVGCICINQPASQQFGCGSIDCIYRSTDDS